MSHQTYTFPITAFPNDAISIPSFEVSIRNIINTPFGYTTVHGDIIKVFFTQALSGTEQTDLDSIVAAHDGIAFTTVKSVYIEDLDESATTSETWQDKITMALTNIEPKEYDLKWSFILRAQATNKQIEARIYNETDDVVIQEVIHEQSSGNIRTPYTGFSKCTLQGDKTIKLQWRKNDNGNISSYISEAKLELGG